MKENFVWDIDFGIKFLSGILEKIWYSQTLDSIKILNHRFATVMFRARGLSTSKKFRSENIFNKFQIGKMNQGFYFMKIRLPHLYSSKSSKISFVLNQ